MYVQFSEVVLRGMDTFAGKAIMSNSNSFQLMIMQSADLDEIMFFDFVLLGS